MIAQNKFIHLNIKQKIYKIAETIRSMEQKLKTDTTTNTPDFSVLDTYLSYIERDKNNRKINRTFEIINNYLIDRDNIIGNTNLVKQLNFCFHDLLALINESIGEKFYKVKQFDNGGETIRFPTAAILDNIRSPFNVGNIFRSADSFGTGELALCGITPHPPSIKIDRTAMGTVDVMTWHYFEQTAQAIEFYRKRGYKIYAMETVEGATPFETITDFENTVFVFGNEEFGITEEMLALCDKVVEIGLVGSKNSINVANTFAVVAYKVMIKNG